LITTHHIIFDGWSRGILYRELVTLYQAFSAGAPCPLPDPGIQYADFASWQREWLQGPTLDALLSYWKRHLRGVGPLPEFELPGARPLPPEPTYRAASQSRKLSPALTEGLGRLSRRERVTPFMLYLAALKAFLHLLTGKEDVGVLSPLANRSLGETEALIGWFANLMVFRTDLSGDPRFQDLLQRVRETTLGAYAHQDLPFAKLLEAFEYHGQPRRPYVFFSMPSNTGLRPQHLPGLSIRPVDLPCVTDIAEPGVEIHLAEKAEGHELIIVYEAERFDAEAVAGLLVRFQDLLEAVAQAPEWRLSALLPRPGD
jgi:hypothetical protein